MAYHYCNALTKTNRPCKLPVKLEGDRCWIHNDNGPDPGFGLSNLYERIQSAIGFIETIEKSVLYGAAAYALIDKFIISLFNITGFTDGTYKLNDAERALESGNPTEEQRGDALEFIKRQMSIAEINVKDDIENSPEELRESLIVSLEMIESFSDSEFITKHIDQADPGTVAT